MTTAKPDRVLVCESTLILGRLMPQLTAAKPDVEFVPLVFDAFSGKSLTEEQYEILKDEELLLTSTKNLPTLSKAMTKLKWAHSLWAGVESLFVPEPVFESTPSWKLTRTVGYMGEMMSEYVITQIVNWQRQNTKIIAAQEEKKWSQLELFYNNQGPLSGRSITIVGLGEIGCDSWTFDDLPEFLSDADFVCCVLPKTEETNGILSDDVLKHCATRKPVFINVGRGNIIKDKEIIKAIDNGWLSGAILDVFEKEPLSRDSPLWSHPEIVITPHVSSMFVPEKAAQNYLENLQRYEEQKPLKHLVNWQTQY